MVAAFCARMGFYRITSCELSYFLVELNRSYNKIEESICLMQLPLCLQEENLICH